MNKTYRLEIMGVRDNSPYREIKEKLSGEQAIKEFNTFVLGYEFDNESKTTEEIEKAVKEKSIIEEDLSNGDYYYVDFDKLQADLSFYEEYHILEVNVYVEEKNENDLLKEIISLYGEVLKPINSGIGEEPEDITKPYYELMDKINNKLTELANLKGGK